MIMKMESDMITNSSLKQGYLHIKRERSSSAIAARVLFKPWQQAYFILRQDPFILEEYKDASLKTQKQIHFIGTIKHVGMIRTSKSKQFAFEIVMCEKTPLLLACDNEILMDEWIHSFRQIMNIINDMRTKKKCNSTPNLYAVDQKENQNVTFEVEIVETLLSNANNLHGDYLLVMSPTRISVMEQEEYVEVLSWPLTCMTFYKSQPSLKRVIFVMGRKCHFGCGKITFETKHCEKIVNFVRKYHSKITERSSSSFSSNTSSAKSEGSYKSKQSLSHSFPEGSLHLLEESLDKPVFDSPDLERKESLRNSVDVPEAEENYNEEVVKAGSQIVSAEEPDAKNESTDGKKTLTFPEISSEDSYILPDESGIDEKWRVTHSNFSRFSRERTHLSRSRQNSDPENEPTSYLQILAEEEVEISTSQEIISNNPDEPVDEDDMQKLLKTITLSLENPKHSENLLETIYSAKKCQSTDSPRPKQNDARRASEPWKKKMASMDKDAKAKLNSTRGTQSIDVVSNIAEHLSASAMDFPGISKNSPNSSPKVFRQHLDGFPKQNSITNKTQLKSAFNHAENHFNPKSNPFHKAESFFSRPLPTFPNTKTGVLSMRRNQGNPLLPMSPKSPELDRNTKPKTRSSSGTNSDSHSSVSSNEDEPEVQMVIAGSNDEPPPLPERTSPKNHRSKSHQTLHRTDHVDNDDDPAFANFSDNSSNNQHVPRKISVGGASVPRKISAGGVGGNRKFSSGGANENKKGSLSGEIAPKNLLAPPPLPPKSKILAPTKSAPLAGSNNETVQTPNPPRRLSYESINKSQETPPEVPIRDYQPQLMSIKSVSSSEGNLLNVEKAFTDTPPRTPTRLSPSQSPKPVSKNPMSKSLDGNQLASILSVTVTDYEEEISVTKKRNSSTFDEQLGNVPIKSLPKSLTQSTSSSGFPKSPKIFF